MPYLNSTPRIARSAQGFRGEVFGGYQLLRRLGAGGMAEVFLASASIPAGTPPRTVALKRMLPHLADDLSFVSRFKREAMITLKLRHPGIARVLDVGRVGRSWFMAMELVAGETLAHAFDEERIRGRRMPASIVRRAGADIAMALDYAHKLGSSDGRPLMIVHRDVSPQNVMVGYDGQVKLIDFGVARWAESDTRTGGVAGKVRYFSPEQARGLTVDRRSDVFSLATMLYEALLGRPVFRGDNEIATMHAILEEDPPPLDGVPADLGAALRRAMSKEPGDRFQDAHQLGVALLGHADGRARLEAGSEDLAAYMAELFPAGAARWGRLLDPSAADHLFDGTDSKEEEKAALGLSDTLTRTRPPGAELPRALEGETVQLLNPREFPVEGSQRTEGPRPKGWPVVWLASHLVRRPRTLAGVATVAAAVLLWMTIDVSPPSPGKAGPEAGAVVRAEASTALCALPSPIALVPSAVGAPSSAAMGSSSIRQRSLEPRKDVPSTGKRAPGKPATAARRPMRRLAVAAAAPAAGHARWSATSVADQLEPSPYADRTR